MNRPNPRTTASSPYSAGGRINTGFIREFRTPAASAKLTGLLAVLANTPAGGGR